MWWLAQLVFRDDPPSRFVSLAPHFPLGFFIGFSIELPLGLAWNSAEREFAGTSVLPTRNVASEFPIAVFVFVRSVVCRAGSLAPWREPT